MDEVTDLPNPDQSATIEPGQTLILRYSQILTQEQAAEIRRRITDRLPDIEICIISSCDQMVVYQSHE